MDITTKIFQIINLILLTLIVVLTVKYSGAIIGFVGSSIGILILFLPVFIGFVLTIMQYFKSKKQKSVLSKLDILLMIPSIIITIVIVLTFIATISI